MKVYWLIPLAIVATASGWIGQRWWAGQQLPGFGQAQAPIDWSIAFLDLEGKARRMDEWRGKWVIVNFWATWCPPCLKEIPAFVKLQAEFPQGNVQFIGVAIDDVEPVREYAAAASINYPVLVGGIIAEEWAQLLGNVTNTLPFSVVFDPAGNLVHTERGEFSLEEILAVVHIEPSSLAEERKQN